MKNVLPKNLRALAAALPTPLYVVGGFTRDFLTDKSLKNPDIDLCAPTPAEEFCTAATALGFNVLSVYKTTGTVKLRDGFGQEYEYACFRSDKYERGAHRPAETYFTTDIVADAKRRDFTCNAVYYDIEREEYVDPLGGIAAIKERRLTTVDNPNKVFGEDGLRLLRLARQAAQLGFEPDEECLLGAKKNAALLADISPERIFCELQLLLFADKKHGLKDAPKRGLQILEKIGALEIVLKELAIGRGIRQRQDFHKFDVLDHTFATVSFADETVRLAALLHDVGKPFCFYRDGNFYAHAEEGAKIAEEILNRLRASKKIVKETSDLVKYHMYDFDCKTGENKLRRFFVRHSQEFLEKLMLLKQADFSGCMNENTTAPTVKKWRDLLNKMKAEKAPFSLKDLALRGNELLEIGIPAPAVSRILNELLMQTAVQPTLNEREKLIKLSLSLAKQIGVLK